MKERMSISFFILNMEMVEPPGRYMLTGVSFTLPALLKDIRGG